MRLLEDGRREGIKDVRAYNAVFRFLSADKKNGAMTELMEQLKGDGLEPNVDTYNYVIYGHATSKDVVSAVRTYDEMIASGLSADSKTLSNMVVAHSWRSTKDMTRTFEELRAKGLEPSRASYHSMVSALRRDENWQAIRTVMHTMIEEGRAPNDPAFAVGFMTARKLGDPDFAKLLLETRGRAGLPLRHDFFVNVMVTLAEAGRPAEVLVLWRQLVCVQGVGSVDIKPETYVLTLRSATKLRAWEEVGAILGMMEERSMPIDDNLYLAVMGQRGPVRDKGEVERVLGFVEQLETRSGAAMAPALQLQLAVVCASAKMFEKAMPLFEVAQNAEVRINGYCKQALVNTLVRLGRHEAVRTVWNESTSKDRKEYIGSMYQLFMTSADNLGDVDWALQLHQACLKGGNKPSRWFHPTVVKMLAEAGRLREAADIAESLRSGGHDKLPPESYSILCRCCMKEDDKKLAVEIVQEMRKGKGALYLPPPGVLGFIISAFIDQRRPSEILKLFDRMRAQNFQPSGDVYALLADAAVEAKHRTKVVEFVAEAKKRGVEASAKAVAFTGGGVFARGVLNAPGAPAGARESTPAS